MKMIAINNGTKFNTKIMIFAGMTFFYFLFVFYRGTVLTFNISSMDRVSELFDVETRRVFFLFLRNDRRIRILLNVNVHYTL